MHTNYADDTVIRANQKVSKCNSCTLDCTLEELAVLRIIADNPAITQKAIAERIEKSERTVKTRTVALQEKSFIRRANGKRNGRWEILADMECTRFER